MIEKNYVICRSAADDLLNVTRRRQAGRGQKGLHCGAAVSWLTPNGQKPTCPKCAEVLAQALWQPWWGHLLEWMILRPLLWLFTGVVILVAIDLTLTQGTITWVVLTGWLYP